MAALFTFLGYAVGTFVFALEAKRKRLLTEGILLVMTAGFAGGMLGAKVTEWTLGPGSPLFNSPAAFFNPMLGGRSLVGGLLVGWLCVVLTKRYLGLRRSTGDMFALALPAGEAVGRIGCFLGGCCYGLPTDAPWAVEQHGVLRHPTQLYALVAAVATFIVLRSLRDKLPEGLLFQAYLAMFGGTRFVIEFFRERQLVVGTLSLVQLVCIELVVVACVVMAFRLRKPKAEVV
jgi:phosphatidylglycerol:prolipoprotein diacylglycerol transferase